MASQTVYLITGANRGIGRAMAASLLLRPSTTIIATARNLSHENAQSLSSLPAADGSKLILLPFDATKPSAFSLDQLPDNGISHIDVVISNAGNSSGGFAETALTVTADALHDDFQVNAVAPIVLFQTCWPLLEKARDPKFVLITSSVGSIQIVGMEAMPGVTYGASKAAANWLVKKVGAEMKGKGLNVGIIHPGWVKTGMGQSLADAVGMAEPPLTVEDSARQVIEQIDKLSPETSGKFLHVDGQELPW
jgi:norsolorinic acid ketoreductase